jgi:murein DD-endopeptidase MepM/ murein hydrolase activator NlpD
MLTSRSRRWLAALFVGTAPLSAAIAQGAQLPPSLELRVPKPPSVGTGESGSFLAYELHLTNMGAQPVTLKRVDVLTADGTPRLLLSIADSALTRSLGRPGAQMPAAERARIAGGSRAVVYVWVPVAGGSAPVSLRNRVAVERGTGDSARVVELDGPAVPVARAAIIIGPPLRGGPWLAANGPSNSSGHRRALIPIAGTPSIAQRFAIDYVKVNAGNSTRQGDSLDNASYHAEGNDALAVADGRVVAIKDSIPENVPGVNSRAVPITLETVGGNHVILDIGGGHYAFYAHLKPGSLRVKVGDRVKRGQVLGLVGNSGNSTEPHLHFHVSDANSPLGSEGIPYGYDSFEVVGRCNSFTTCERTAPKVRHGEIPLQNALVRFP